jgi:hypothetical protein
MKVSKTDREQSLAWLHDHIKPGDTVYTIVESVSRSGMSRVIRVVLLKTDDQGKPYTLHPNHAISTVLGLPRGKKEGVKIQGCGMDMGFEIVYQLGKAMWPNGTPEPHGVRNGEPDHDGGYALNHRWL